jgi:lipopolysaccharide/colanic/teichoic acid biosynthesis glycosyltransferase
MEQDLTGTVDGRMLRYARSAAPSEVAVPATTTLVPDTWYVRRGKRALDVATATVALVVLSPLLLAATVGVLLTLGRPVLYRQVRVGRHGLPFGVLKFRTMHHDRRGGGERYDGPDRRRDHKSDHDPRHTGFGRFLRRTSMDELPQLWNVLRGEMSVVGPRPEMVAVAERHGLIDHPRHLVRPGLTGLWQVSGDRPGYVHENVHYDERYVQQMSFRLDTRILLQTLGAVVRGTGR